MAATVPRFIVIKPYDSKGCLLYKDGYVAVEEESVKIEVEPATTGNKFLHLRFSHTNKYWERNAQDGFMVARSNQPEEDTSKPSCTLFEPTIVNNNGVFYFTHVQSGGRLQIDAPNSRVTVNENPIQNDGRFTSLDWDTLVKLPAHVAFKGDDGSYLKAYYFNDLPDLQFLSGDANDELSGYNVELMQDGHVQIMPNHFGKLWRNGQNWIWADGASNNINALFWPVKIDDNTTALRSAANNNFCKRLTDDNKTNCLNASVSTITNEAKLGVKELVLERKIYNVIYRMEDARIFDEKPFVAGTATAVNRADEEDSISVEVSYSDERSYSFSRSLSITAGVTTTIEADVR